MIVVSDTSPLTNLAAIGQFELLRQLKGLLDSVRPHLDALRTLAGFYISEALYSFVLQAVGEQ